MKTSGTLWISPQDRLPDKDEEMVLICCSGRPTNCIRYDHSFALAEYYRDEGWIVDEFPEWKPTVHWWMKIPPLPEE